MELLQACVGLYVLFRGVCETLSRSTEVSMRLHLQRKEGRWGGG